MNAGDSNDRNWFQLIYFCIGALLVLFFYRLLDLGITHSDDAGWLLHTLQGNWRDGPEMAFFQGRIWAFVSGPIVNFAMYLQGSPFADVYRLGCLAVFFVAFYAVLSIYVGRPLASLAATLNLALFALRWEGSMVTTYPALFGVLGSLFVGSVWAGWKYAQSGRASLLWISLLGFFVSLFMHEGVTLLFCLLFPVTVVGNHFLTNPETAGMRSVAESAIARKHLIGAFAVIGAYFVIYMGWRWAFPTGYGGNRLDTFSPLRIGSTTLALSTSGTLLSDLVTPYYVRYGDVVMGDGYTVTYRFSSYLKDQMYGPAACLAGMLTACVVFLLGRNTSFRPSGAFTRRTTYWFVVLLVGLAIALAPILPVALTQKYQQQFFDLDVRSHVYTALSHFGWTLVLAALLAGLFSIGAAKGIYRTLLSTVLALATGVLAYGGYQMNDAIASDMRTETSRWKAVDRASSIVSLGQLNVKKFYAPRLAGGSWFAGLPPEYWSALLQASRGSRQNFASTAPRLQDLKDGQLAYLDFALLRRGAEPLVIVAPLDAPTGNAPVVAQQIYIGLDSATPSELAQYTVSFTDLKNGPVSYRLSSFETMAGSNSVWRLSNVQAVPASIRVSANSVQTTFELTCPGSAANETVVAVGPASYGMQPQCLGDMFMQVSDDSATDWRSIASFLGQPLRTSKEGEWRLTAYPFAIYSQRPRPNFSLQDPVRLLMLPRQIPHQIGAVHQTGSGLWLAAAPGEEGTLAFGPYATLAKGRYEVGFQLSVHDPKTSGSLGEVDVSVNGGQRVASALITGTPDGGILVLPFDVTQSASNYEFRVFSKGQATIRLKSVMLRQVRNPQ